MPSQFDKLWIQDSAIQTAIQQAQQAIQYQGAALPCRVVSVNGAIVTVAFQANSLWTLPNITIPKAESPWVRMPTQAGDLGVTMPADWYLGGISGLGGGVADTAQPGNLSALVFVPVSNANSGPIDANAAQVQGPNGAILRTTAGTTSSMVLDTSGTTLTFGTNTLVVDAAGVTITVGTTVLQITGAEVAITVGGKSYTFASDAVFNGLAFGTHTHAYYPGTGNQTDTSGPV